MATGLRGRRDGAWDREPKAQSPGIRMPQSLVPGSQSLVPGPWFPVPGPWFPVPGPRSRHHALNTTYANAAITALIGIVRIHAHTMRRATPQRTADRR